MAELWIAPSGKVHVLRHYWYAGTIHERAADPSVPIMLCGQRKNLERWTADNEVTCVTCFRAMPKEKT